jgi:hypothetical protein
MATPRPGQRAPFGPTLALTVILAVAGFALLMPLVMMLSPPKRLPAPFPPQHQTGETRVYLLAFVLILPSALVGGRRLAERFAGTSLLPLTALLAALLAIAVIAAKGSGTLGFGDGVRTVLLAAVLWWAAALVLLLAERRGALTVAARHATLLVGAAAILTFVALLCFVTLRSVSRTVLALGALAVAAAVAAYLRRGPSRLERGWRIAIDVAVLGAVLLLVPDLVILRPEQAADPAIGVETGIIQFHQDFLLGPAFEVLNGRAMLVDTASQYGVTSIYLLAGWFQLAPIGYGTFGLLTGGLTALWFGAGYAVLRLAGTSRPLSAAAMGVAVVALAFNLTYPVGALPQSGPLRFGLPMAVVLAAVAGERFPAHARAARVAAFASLGLASIWSLESLAFTAVALTAVLGVQAWLAPGPGRVRRLARQAALAGAACVCAHAIFAVATLAATGRLPDWPRYLAYLREFLFGSLGDLTYDVVRWTPALPLGAGYLASAAAIAELVRRRGRIVERERAALVALTGSTAYGIALLSYYVDRSQDHILMHVALPGVLTGALWLGLLLRAPDTLAPAARAGGLGFGLAVAALVVAVAWSSVGERFPRTAPSLAVPGGWSLSGALDRLWHLPPLDPSAPAGERALERHMPGRREALIMVSPDLGIEIQLRSGRVDKLFLGDPWETSFVGKEELPRLAARVAALRPGERMLLDRRALEFLERLRERPSLNPLFGGIALLAPLQQWALKRIAERFRLRSVAPDRSGFRVVELVPDA